MSRTHLLTAAMAMSLLIAAFSRFHHLADRPLHGDEANQAHKTGVLLEKGVYKYDPHEHHGPTLYYLAAGIYRLTGVRTFADMDAWRLRLVPVLAGMALVALVLALGRWLGRNESLIAALLTTLSPAMIYYSRYFVQEMLLAALTLAMLLAGARYLESGRRRWAVMTGLCVGCMHATKETFAFAIVAAIIAALSVWWARSPAFRLPRFRGDAIACLVAAAFVSILFFSSFGSHPRGPLDSFTTYTSYLGRAAASTERTDGASLHEQPWWYYFRVLFAFKNGPGNWWSEAIIAPLALAGFFTVFKNHFHSLIHRLLLRATISKRSRNPEPVPSFPLFIALYTLILAAIYAAIPYKTPWCALSFHTGFLLIAGYGCMWLWRLSRRIRWRAPLAALVLIGFGHLVWENHWLNGAYAADYRNPYAYAHTAGSTARFAEQLEQRANAQPEGHAMLIQVIEPTGDYWPLPWYLRRFPHVGYWSAWPDTLNGALIIIPPELAPELEKRLGGEFSSSYFGLRPGKLMLACTPETSAGNPSLVE